MTRWFVLDHSWQGSPLPGPHPRLALELSPATSAIFIDAPAPGDPAPKAPPGRLWRLWEHEVVELFIAGPAGSYLELELGPHGHHLLLALDRPRHIVDDALPLESYNASCAAGRWRGEARLARRLLPPTPWRFNLYAIRGLGLDREHRALFPLPGEKPDFHQPAAFGSWNQLPSAGQRRMQQRKRER